MADEPKGESMTRRIRSWDLVPTSQGDAMELAKIIADSDFAPKDYRGKPANVLIAVQLGLDIGLKPLQAIQNIAIVNGRPTVFGDAALALVLASGLVESLKEWTDDKGTAHCTIKRRGLEPVERTFSVEQSKTAGLAGKVGPWTQYPDRMRQMRARGFALRDAAPDLLMGLLITEEAQDIGTVPIEQSAEEAMLSSLTEVERATVQKAVEALHLSPAQTRVFIMRHLTRSDRAMSESVAAMLDDMRDEFSKRKTGKPAKKQVAIEAVVVPEEVAATPAEAELPSPEQMAAEEAAYDGPAPEESVDEPVKPEPKKAAGKGNRFSF